MKLKQTVISLFALLLLPVAISSVLGGQASAASCGGVDTSIIQCGKGTGCDNDAKVDEKTGKCPDGTVPSLQKTAIWSVLLMILNILTALVGIAAVGGIVYGAIMYASASDKADQAKKGMEIIRNVVIGILAYIFMYAFLNFLIPGGIFA